MGLFAEYRTVSRLLREEQGIVFYAESRHYYQYFQQLISDILQYGPVCYITSDKNDPLLKSAPAGMKVVYCKWMLGFLFKQLRARMMIMTMPDLGNYFLKRSPGVKKYLYVFHAAVSTHLQYRKQAFDHYDLILCTGDYQVQEIRKAEAVYGLPAKELLPYGYPLISALQQQPVSLPDKEHPLILLAPSWFAGCIFETGMEELLQVLSGIPCRVLVRSHPEYEKRYPARFRQIKKMLKAFPQMQIDANTDVRDSLLAADILITDRSGIAFEFAFGTRRPVLFIDTALKQTNPDWQELGIEPVENRYRSLMGLSVTPDKIQQVPERIQQLKELSNSFAENIKRVEKEIFFLEEGLYKATAKRIVEM